MPTHNASATLTVEPKPGKKYFTVDEANRSLAYVTKVVGDITACYDRVVDLRKRIEMPSPEDKIESLETRYEQAMDQLSDLVDELHHVGVELKDFEKGLIDFPAIHEGREIYLCWQQGEQQIEAWHEIDAGFAGRQSMDQLAEV